MALVSAAWFSRIHKVRATYSSGYGRLLKPFARTARMGLNPTATIILSDQMRPNIKQINKTFVVGKMRDTATSVTSVCQHIYASTMTQH